MINYSLEYATFMHELEEKNSRKRVHVDPKYRHAICLNAAGQVIAGLERLFEVIVTRRAA